MSHSFLSYLSSKIKEISEAGTFKKERVISSPQQAKIAVQGKEVFNFCANNYLGLSNHPEIIKAAIDALKLRGYGLSSVRFICGTQDIHKELEERVSNFLGTEDTILFSSCFDANGGLFEALLSEEDAIISDALNHASIIDGIRLSKAKRFKYENNNMVSLENELKAAKNFRFKLIATDGVFSMDGIIANLKAICELKEKYDALLMVDDSHAVGFMGQKGRGTHEYCDVMGRVDILTGTFGKALGGASGGYVSGRKEIIEWLRQRSRPYLFSNTLSPVIVYATLKAIDLIEGSSELRENLHSNSQYFRNKMQSLGFSIVPGEHPIVPIMLGDARLSSKMAEMLLNEGVYVIGFSYPVVPEGKARIRVQLSAAHTKSDIDFAISQFEKVGKKLKVI